MMADVLCELRGLVGLRLRAPVKEMGRTGLKEARTTLETSREMSVAASV
jgi:hypothetical protein